MGFFTNIKMKRKAAGKKRTQVRQAELKTDLGMEEKEDLIVVERTGTVKFLIKSIGGLIRLIATICILVLAFIGIVALVYPEPRGELIVIFRDGMDQLAKLIR